MFDRGRGSRFILWGSSLFLQKRPALCVWSQTAHSPPHRCCRFSSGIPHTPPREAWRRAGSCSRSHFLLMPQVCQGQDAEFPVRRKQKSTCEGIVKVALPLLLKGLGSPLKRHFKEKIWQDYDCWKQLPKQRENKHSQFARSQLCFSSAFVVAPRYLSLIRQIINVAVDTHTQFHYTFRLRSVFDLSMAGQLRKTVTQVRLNIEFLQWNSCRNCN